MMSDGREHDPVGLRIGILGGGQLALMIADAAVAAGKQPVVLAVSADEPAVRAGHEAVIGSPKEVADLERFLERVDLLTIENEFLDLAVLDTALEGRPGLPLYPSRAAIALAQDKLAQKRLFDRLELPTARYLVLSESEVEIGADADADLERLHAAFPGGFVLKWSRFGYDGRGNLVVGSRTSPNRREIERFCAAGLAAGATIYAEALIDFSVELAMVSARGGDGAQAFLPLVTTRQERGVCREVLGPATDLGLAPEIEAAAQSQLAALGEALDFCGAFAVEFFVAGDGVLLINEMAPRVHNSGHGSLWRDEISQFDLHLRAISHESLDREPACSGLILMRNILGPDFLEVATLSSRPVEEPPTAVTLHWYGKKLAAKGRKMGHLTARADSMQSAERIRATMVAWEDRYWNSMRQAKETQDAGKQEGAGGDHHGIEFGPGGHEGSCRSAR